MNSAYGCGMDPEVPELDLSKADALAAKTSPKLLEALQEEVSAIMEGGVNIRSLMELSKFTHVAQELLMVRTPLAEVRRKKRPRLAGGGPMLSGPGGMMQSSMGPYQTMYDEEVGPMTQEAATNETFGAQVTRELVSAIGSMKRSSGASIQDLISGIEQAKKAGLDSLAAKLEMKLDEAIGGSAAEEAKSAEEPEGLEHDLGPHDDENCIVCVASSDSNPPAAVALQTSEGAVIQ